MLSNYCIWHAAMTKKNSNDYHNGDTQATEVSILKLMSLQHI